MSKSVSQPQIIKTTRTIDTIENMSDDSRDMQKNFFSGMAYSIFVHNGKGWLGIANRR
jgi:hypothetical protein